MIQKLISLVLIWFILVSCSGCRSEQEQRACVSTDVPVESSLPEESISAANEEVLYPDNGEKPPEVTFPDEPAIPWYTASRLIYHACGGLDGAMYTNSREAIAHTLAMGNFLVEVDFLFTADDILVCAHRWEEFSEDGNPLVMADFLKHKIGGLYSTMTALDVISYMEQFPALYIVVDTKERDLPAVVAELVALCDSDPDILNRFVLQVYGRNMKEKVKEIFPFKDENILFSCYKFGPERYYEILNICRDDNISIVTVPYDSWDSDIICKFQDRGIILFEHTVNLPEDAVHAMVRGIYGIYTDFLSAEEFAANIQ